MLSQRSISALAIAIGGSVLVGAFGGLSGWIGVAAIGTVAPELAAAAAPRFGARARRMAALAPYLAVAVLFMVLLGELALGRPPITRDHGIHYFQTHLLVTDFLPSGRLTGWSDRLNQGYPFGENYPTLCYLWTGAGNLLTFGAVPLRVSYAWGILAAWALGVAATWWLAALLAHEFLAAEHRQAIPWVGAIAAALWLTDAGGSRQGGWTYVMFHGVWPQMLSAGLWILSLALTWRALQHPSPRRLALAGGVLGASALAHPFGMITAAGSAAVWLAVLLVSPVRRALPAGRFRFWLAVHALALAVALGWSLVFFGSADSMLRAPVAWKSLGDLSTELLVGGAFDRASVWLTPLCALGAIVAATRSRALGWVALASLAGMLILSSHESITSLRLDLLVPGFKNLQFPRYAIPIKPLMFALAGVGGLAAVLGARALVRRGGDQPADSRPRRFALWLLAAPFVVGVLSDAGRLVERPTGSLETFESSGYAQHEADLRAALRAEALTLPDDRPLRVAFLRERMGGGTYPLFSIADVDGAAVVDGHIPTVNFNHRATRTVEALSAMGVTHAIHDKEIPESEAALAAALEVVGEYGPYTLARLQPLGKRSYVFVDGTTIAATHGEPGELTAQIPATEAGVRLLWPSHSRFEATLGTQTVALEERTLVGRTKGSVAKVSGAGALRVRYRHSSAERAGAWVTGIAILLCLVGLAFPRPLLVAERMHAPRAVTAFWVLAAAAAAIIVLFVLRRQREQLATTWDTAAEDFVKKRGRAPPTFARDLVLDGDIGVVRDPEPICVGVLGKDVLEGCSETAHREVEALQYRKPYLYRCLEFTVPARGEATLTLGSGGTDVIGFLTRQVKKGKGKHLKYNVSKTYTLANRRADFHIRAARAQDGATILLTNTSRSPERVCLSAAEVAWTDE